MFSSAAPSPVESESVSQDPSALKVVLFYDTPDARHHALSTLAHVLGVAERGMVEVISRQWPLNFVRSVDSCQAASDDLQDANIVALATQGTTPLSWPFKLWLAAMLDQNSGRKASLVALLGFDAESCAEISRDTSYLQRLALRANFDFISPAFARIDSMT